MTKELKMVVGVALLAALALAGALGIFTFSAAQPVGAQTVSTDVMRSFGESQVANDGTVTVDVTISVTNVDLFALTSVTETLPAGWEYKPASAVTDTGLDAEATPGNMGNQQTVSFTIIGPTSVTYTVWPGMAERGTFSGMATIEQLGSADIMGSVGGPATVTVGTVTPAPVTPAPVTPAPVTPDEEDAPPAVKLSSKTAGASVQVTINSEAEDKTITSATDITVNLKKFGVPSSISESSVNINDTDKQGDGARGYSGEPNSVTVDGTKITLALYSRFPGQELDAGNITGRYTITFKQSAGITNPIVGTGRGTVVIKDADTIDHTDDRVVINSKVSLSKGAGARGTAVTVSAVGLLGGGATAFLVQGDCTDQGKDPAAVAALADLQETNENATADDLDPEVYPEGTDCAEEDDISLGTGTASGGKVSVDIDTSSSDFVVGNEPYDKLGNNIWADWNRSSGSSLAEGTFRDYDRTIANPYVPSDSQRGANQITTVDGSGRTADVSAYFTITPTITPEDEGVQQGRRVDHPRGGLVLRKHPGRDNYHR